jgi:hypothetical protein
VVEINTWIHQVLDLGANSNPGAGPIPLQEGVACTRVSMFGTILVSYAILSFQHAHIHAQEASRAPNVKMWAWGEREQAWSSAR